MMKRIALSLMIVILSVFMMSTAVSGASAFSVDQVDYTAELRSNGNALITETWTVTFNGESDCFVREIMIPEDNFEKFNEIYDLSVSVDGNGCSEVDEASVVNGTYSVEKTEDRYIIKWFIQSEDETRTFSLRYVQSGIVKLYNDRAYFYSTVANAESNLLCRNVTITVTTPKNCFAEDFSIIESGSLVGQKSNGEVVFKSVNSVGLIKTGISMPSGVFEASVIPVIVDDNTVEKTILIVVGVICGCILVFCVFYAVNYRKFFRNRWERKCRKKAHSESSYRKLTEIFRQLSPARILNIVSAGTVSGADFFIVTFLDLLERGYIQASAGGFTASEISETDSVGRPLDKTEKAVIDFFGSEKWKNMVARPKRFFFFVKKFNRKIKFVSPLTEFSQNGKKMIRRCFELKLSAKRYEFIYPEEISDDIFKSGKYTSFDLIISLINEYSLAQSEDFSKNGAERFKRNMFVLRDTYEEGKNIVAQEEFERKQQKKQKKKMVIDDDIDSQ